MIRRLGKYLAMMTLFAVIAVGVLIKGDYLSFDKTKEASLDYGWELIMVNSEYTIPETYEPKLLTLSNGERVDERIYPDLQKMFDDMREEGHRPVVVSGYRSGAEQESILEDKRQVYENEGYPELVAREMALQWVALPGTSEHQLGIAVDINPDYSVTKGWGFYEWLRENAHKYGFIKRYPEDKVDITGISNEPWHYRYVGKEAAKIIYEEKLCLEEYLEFYFMK